MHFVVKSEICKLRATWNHKYDWKKIDDPYFCKEILCVFVVGDHDIRDYLEHLSDDVLMSYEYHDLTSRIYQFTKKLVEDGIAEWAEEPMECRLYKNGFDPKTWAPCQVVRMIEPLWNYNSPIDPKYAYDLWSIYQLGLKSIYAAGLLPDDVRKLSDIRMRTGTKASEVYLYYLKYNNLSGWRQKGGYVRDGKWGDFIEYKQQDLDMISDKSAMKRALEDTNLKQYPLFTFLNDYCRKLNKVCKSEGIKPFERPGFVADVSPEIVKEILTEYNDKKTFEFKKILLSCVERRLEILCGFSIRKIIKP